MFCIEGSVVRSFRLGFLIFYFYREELVDLVILGFLVSGFGVFFRVFGLKFVSFSEGGVRFC